MRAVDTKVVVRYLTGDDPGQSAGARTVIDAGDVFVGTTVLLEGEWVLRSVYGFSRAGGGGSLARLRGTSERFGGESVHARRGP